MSDARQITDKTINYLLRVPNYGDAMLRAMTQYLNYLDRDKNAEILTKYINKGGDLLASYCRPEHLKELDRRLEAAGITHVAMTNAELGGIGILVFADKDKARVEEILNEYRAEIIDGGVVDRGILDLDAEGNVREMKNMSLEEAMLFSEHAKEAGVKIAVEEPYKNKFTVLYSADDRQKMEAMKAAVAVELSGAAGKALKAQLRYENKKTVEMIAAVMDPEQKVYIAGLDGSVLKSDADGFTVKIGKEEQTFDRKSDTFQADAASQIASIQGAVKLTAEEYEKYRSLKWDEKKEFLFEADRRGGRPECTAEQAAAIRRMADEHTLYEMKLSRDNPEQDIFTYAYTNNEMRMASFEAFERMNEESSHDKREAGMSDPVFMDDARARFRGFDDEPVSISYKKQKEAEDIIDGRFDHSKINEWMEEALDRNAEMADMDFDLGGDVDG